METAKATSSLLISFRLAKAAEQLASLVQAGPQGDMKGFVGCCISLSKLLDFAIANDEVPAKAQELPSLFKQSACQLGWFTLKENQELSALADEIGNSFGSLADVSSSLITPVSPLSQIMERFYPFLKLGHILLSDHVKPGFAMLVTGFHVAKKMLHSPHQQIRLFVAQTDNIETSTCIMNPPQVSFLLNGKGIEKRVNISMDSGPQLPTNVTPMLKDGSNLLQAMGHFNGHYTIVLAFTDVVPLPDTSLLKDYVQPAVVESNSDSDIIEGPSRISLNCPISRTRIKLPVKGHLCKHLQCFDFGNYVNINMRRPSWRCPHCNQPVCYTDIRVDQNIFKVLKEVGHCAADVIISADGSWKVVTENDENMDPVQEIEHDLEDPTSFLNADLIVLDLTGDNHEMDTCGKTEADKLKPLQSDHRCQSDATNSTTVYNNVNNAVPNVDFSPEIHFSNSLSPDCSSLNQFSASINGTPQPAQTSNTAIGLEYANLSQIPRTRSPVAIQALPAQFLQNPSSQDRPTSTVATLNTSIPTAQYSQAQTPPLISTELSQGGTSSLERLHLYPRASPNPPQVLPTTSSQNFPVTQSLHHHTRVQSPGQLRTPPPPPPAPSSSRPQPQTLPGVTISQQTRFVNGGRTAAQMGSYQRLNNPGGGAVQSVSRASDLIDVTTDTNWRPQGRMRGSLVPGSYSPALDHLIIRPSQQSQPTIPPASQPVQTPSTQPAQTTGPNLNAQIQAFLASIAHHTTQAGSSPVGVPGLRGSSQTMPPQNPGTR